MFLMPSLNYIITFSPGSTIASLEQKLGSLSVTDRNMSSKSYG